MLAPSTRDDQAARLEAANSDLMSHDVNSEYSLRMNPTTKHGTMYLAARFISKHFRITVIARCNAAPSSMTTRCKVPH